MVATAMPVIAQESVPVSVIGCPGDGQQGWIEPPKNLRPIFLPKAQADLLAFYIGNELATLAPRAWHCIELYGSNGSILLVTPEWHTSNDLFGSKLLTSSFVIVEQSYASTSGRFRVASVAGSLFPVAKKFVDGVKREPDVKIDFVSIAKDKLVRHSPTMVEFTTPANQDGLGIDGWVQKTALPISGLVILTSDMDLAMMRLRLPAEMGDLGKTIIDLKLAELGRK
jgi:hypothetical protein